MFVVLLQTMQAFCSDITKHPYNGCMQTGRPSERKRPPFGEHLYQLREQAGLTQNQIAEQLGISARAYAFWEREPVALKPEQLSALADIFGITVDSLLGRKQKKKRSSGGPIGKARKLFDEVNKMPRHQQQRILSALDDMIAGQKAKQSS